MNSVESLFASHLAKLRRLATLDPDDMTALLSLPQRTSQISGRSCLMREGAPAEECCILVKGFASRSKLAKNGGRQIVSFHVAGDLLGFDSLFLEQADHDVQTVTDATLVWIALPRLKELVARRPAIAAAFWRDALIDASIGREWVLNVGRRNAKARVAHPWD